LDFFSIFAFLSSFTSLLTDSSIFFTDCAFIYSTSFSVDLEGTFLTDYTLTSTLGSSSCLVARLGASTRFEDSTFLGYSTIISSSLAGYGSTVF
jgi:hypothetical protein